MLVQQDDNQHNMLDQQEDYQYNTLDQQEENQYNMLDQHGDNQYNTLDQQDEIQFPADFFQLIMPRLLAVFLDYFLVTVFLAIAFYLVFLAPISGP